MGAIFKIDLATRLDAAIPFAGNLDLTRQALQIDPSFDGTDRPFSTSNNTVLEKLLKVSR